jgi:hypothetical protein
MQLLTQEWMLCVSVLCLCITHPFDRWVQNKIIYIVKVSSTTLQSDWVEFVKRIEATEKRWKKNVVRWNNSNSTFLNESNNFLRYGFNCYIILLTWQKYTDVRCWTWCLWLPNLKQCYPKILLLPSLKFEVYFKFWKGHLVDGLVQKQN